MDISQQISRIMPEEFISEQKEYSDKCKQFADALERFVQSADAENAILIVSTKDTETESGKIFVITENADYDEQLSLLAWTITVNETMENPVMVQTVVMRDAAPVHGVQMLPKSDEQ